MFFNKPWIEFVIYGKPANPILNKTLADLDMSEKNLISHRAMAVKKAIQYLLR